MARIREIVSSKKSGTFSYSPKGTKTEYAKKHPKEYEALIDSMSKKNKSSSAKSEALKKKMAGDKKPWIRHGVSKRYEFHPNSIENKKGHGYSVYYSDRTKGKTTERPYPNYTSAVFKKKSEAQKDAELHRKRGYGETYGSAEK